MGGIFFHSAESTIAEKDGSPSLSTCLGCLLLFVKCHIYTVQKVENQEGYISSTSKKGERWSLTLDKKLHKLCCLVCLAYFLVRTFGILQNSWKYTYLQVALDFLDSPWKVMKKLHPLTISTYHFSEKVSSPLKILEYTELGWSVIPLSLHNSWHSLRPKL